jgi:hypothetical protein
MVWRLIQTFRLRMDELGEGEEGMLDYPTEEITSGTALPASASARGSFPRHHTIIARPPPLAVA